MQTALMKYLSLALLLLAAGCSSTGDAPGLRGPVDVVPIFSKANDEAEAGRYTDARQLFEEVKREDLTGEWAPIAQLRIADTYFEDEPELAIEEYREFLSVYPRHKYAAYAMYRIAMVHYSQINGPDRGFGPANKAIDAFESLNAAHPRSPYRYDALMKIELAREVLAEHEFLVGDFYFQKGSCEGAVSRLATLREDYPDFTRTSGVLYRLALCYATLHKDDLSAEALSTLRATYPGSDLIADAEEEVAEIVEHRDDPPGFFKRLFDSDG